MRIKRGILSLLALVSAGMLAAAGGRGQSGSKLDPESEKFYQTARLIMTSDENKIWKRLPDAESRQEFIKDFWDKRDPDPDTEDNEFKREFEARVEYANKRFREGGLGMNTDRGRVYIFMGPPDKFEEFMTHEDDPTVRGPILWWVYYSYDLGIEFVDERNTGQYKMRTITGDFFGAMDLFKLGQWVGPDSVFKKRVVDFKLKYDGPAQEFTVLIPAKFLLLRENNEGKFQVDLDFKFYVYENEAATRSVFADSRSYVTADPEYEKSGDIAFTFAHPLKPGKAIVDVIIKAKEGAKGKIRKIFDIKAGR
jgi:GWxTD domain-containing protein